MASMVSSIVSNDFGSACAFDTPLTPLCTPFVTGAPFSPHAILALVMLWPSPVRLCRSLSFKTDGLSFTRDRKRRSRINQSNAQIGQPPVHGYYNDSLEEYDII
jgi:hypothetical protein